MNKLISFKRLILSIFAFIFFAEMLFVASGTYGKTDDYVFLGLFTANNASVFETFKYISEQDWNAGRWVGNIFLSIMFQSGNSISTLTVFRVIAVIILGLGFLMHLRNLAKLESSLSKRLLLAAPIILVPGIHSFITLSASNPYIIATVLALGISSFICTNKFWSIRNVAILTLSLSFIGAIYQSSIFLVLVYPALFAIKEKFSKLSGKRLFNTFAISCGALLLNWLAIKVLIDSPRSSIEIDLLPKIKIFFTSILDQVVVPWFRLGHVDGEIVHLVTALILIINLALVIFQYRVRHADIEKRSMYEYFSLVFCGTGGLPFTMPWFFVISENAMDFRRYAFATATFYSIFVFNLIKVSSNFPRRNTEKFLISALSILITVTFSFTSYHDIQTRNILVKEWSLFLCASEQVALPEISRIESKQIRQILQGNREVSEDFSTASISFPNPPTLMLWLSQRQTREGVDYPPWNLNLLTPDLVLSETKEGRDWRNAFIKCSQANG